MQKLNWRILVLLALLVGSLALLRYRSRVQAWARGVPASALVGRAAPELPTGSATLDGRPLELASLRGRVVLLHFWTFG